MISSLRRSLSGYWQWSLIPTALVCTCILAPVLLSHGMPALSLILNQGFSLVCHQRPERCFWICGAPIAVCARCLGIYLGTALGFLLRASQRFAFRLLVATASINVLDALGEVAGLHGNWLELRFIFGLAVGTAVGMLLASAQAFDVPPADPAAHHPRA